MADNVTGWRSADNSVPSRPATEVDYLDIVQVIEFCRLRPSAGTIAKTMNQKVEERIPSARIFANLVLHACDLSHMIKGGTPQYSLCVGSTETIVKNWLKLICLQQNIIQSLRSQACRI